MSIVKTLYALYKHFKYRDCPNGFCKGFSLNWLEAILLSEQMRCDFEAHIRELTLIPFEKLIPQLAYKSDLKEFIVRLFVFQSPQLFSTRYLQDYRKLNLVSSQVSSIKMKKEGGFDEIFSDSHIFTQSEFINYLVDLTHLFEKLAQGKPIGILCSNAIHAHALAYRPKKGWSSRDINDKEIKINLSPQVIATETFDYLCKNSDLQSSNYACFNIKIIVTGYNENKKDITKALNFLSSCQPITKKIAFRQSHRIDLFYIAAVHGNLEKAKQLVFFKTNMNRRDEMGNTMSFYVTKDGDLSMLKFLYENGANLNLKQSMGTTLVHIAATTGNLIVLNFLKELNLPFNLQDESGNVPIHYAALMGHVDVIKFMAANEIILNPQNKNKLTPMFIACALGNKEVISVLEEYGEIKITSDPTLNKNSKIKGYSDSNDNSLLLYLCRFLDEISLLAFFIPIVGQIYLGARIANYFEPLTKGIIPFLIVINPANKRKERI